MKIIALSYLSINLLQPAVKSPFESNIIEWIQKPSRGVYNQIEMDGLEIMKTRHQRNSNVPKQIIRSMGIRLGK